MSELQGVGRFKFHEVGKLDEPDAELTAKLAGSPVRVFTPFLSM